MQCKRCGIELGLNNKGEYCYPCETEIDWKIKTKQLFWRTCRWCGVKFLSNVPNKLYCSDKHLKEAKRENDRRYSQKRYGLNRKVKILSQIGTTCLGKHPNSDFKKEKRIIENEKKRTLPRTVYKGKYNYAKKSMRLTAIDHPLGQYGIQLTHNYATLDDYHKTSLNHIMNQKTRKCIDCNQTEVNKDRQHAEIQCSNCGLFLMGPYDLRVKYPFMEYPQSTDEPVEDIDPMSWYPKPERYDKGGNVISFDKTPIKVICSKCKKADTIPFNIKKDGCPTCGGHWMGAGICMPQDYNDEFSSNTGDNIAYDMRTTEERAIGE